MDSLKTFCEFPIMGAHQNLTWHRDPQLVRYLGEFKDRSTVEIADLLVNRILTDPIDRSACACITALLAHILFSASGRAKIRSQIFDPLQYHSTQIELEDVYQIALDIISQPVHFSANFQPDPVNWYGSLVRYSGYRFDRLLIDRIRSLPGLIGFKRTNLGLLALTSPRRMKTALIERGERDLRLQQLLLLHQCLIDVNAVNEFDTRDPQPVHYDNLSAQYIEQCDLAIDNRDTLIELLEYMGVVIRNYLLLKPVSIDACDPEGKPLIDLIPDPSDRRHQLESSILKQDVVQLSNNLAIDSDRLLMFFYGLELTQIEVGVELECDQSTAKRRRDRCLTQLAKDLHTSIFPTADLSIELLSSIIDPLQLIYEDLYAESLSEIFERIVAARSSTTFGTAKLNESSITDLFIEQIEKQWQFNFKPAQQGLAKATAFVMSR